MQELVVISGKGGTGKTSLTAAFAVLADQAVVADCDVDAADLHLLLSPKNSEQHAFISGHEAFVRQEHCIGCALCKELCRFDAVRLSQGLRGAAKASIDPIACEGCGVCVRFCPGKAIAFRDRYCGEWMISKSRCGPMVHARLGAAAENSGKLVSRVRREARRIAEATSNPLVIIDGPPGIGCPVIASVTGATLALVVTEPTVAGEHDLERILSLTRHFAIPTAICVNKWDLNPEIADRAEGKAREAGAKVAGRIRYDPAVTHAQMRKRTAVEAESGCAEDIERVWNGLGF
jgi:MinD superfamily P-loop ATPase